MSLEVDAAPEGEDAAHAVPRTGAANELIGAETADSSIFKWGTDRLEEVQSWPVYMIVHEDGQRRLDLWKGITDLQALVSNIVETSEADNLLIVYRECQTDEEVCGWSK